MLSRIFLAQAFPGSDLFCREPVFMEFIGFQRFQRHCLEQVMGKAKAGNKILVDLYSRLHQSRNRKTETSLTFKQWAKIFLGTLYLVK